MSRVAALLNALGTSQHADLAQLLIKGWVVDDRVIQFYGDLSDNPAQHIEAPGKRAAYLGLRSGDIILALGTATTYAELAAEVAAELAAAGIEGPVQGPRRRHGPPPGSWLEAHGWSTVPGVGIESSAEEMAREREEMISHFTSAGAAAGGTAARSRPAPFLVLKKDSWPSSTPVRTAISGIPLSPS